MLLPSAFAAMFLAAAVASAATASSPSPAASAATASPSPAGETSFDPSTVVNVTARPMLPRDAPADEYFGRLKLSGLGVRNIIHALAVEGNSSLALPLERTRIMGVTSALHQWGDLYPGDSWLRNVMLNFAYVLALKHDVDTDDIAIATLLQASIRYSSTPYGKIALNRANAIVPASNVDWTVPPFDPPTLADIAALFAKGS